MSALRFILLMILAWPQAASAQDITSWSTQTSATRIVRNSQSSSAGTVSLVAYYPVAFQGAFATWFANEANRFAGELPRVTNRTPVTVQRFTDTTGAVRELYKMSFTTTKSDALEVAALVAGYVTRDGTAQLAAILRPQQMPDSDPNHVTADKYLKFRWQMGLGLAQRPEPQTAGTPPPAQPSPPPLPKQTQTTTAPSASADGPPIGSARNFADIRSEHNQGLAMITPCEPGQTPILTSVFRRHTAFNANLASEVTGESQRLTQAWTGNGQVNFGAVQGDGQAATRVAKFNTADGSFIAWFTAQKGTSYYVHRAYVVAPAQLANDQRFAAAIEGARRMMAVSGWPSVDATGTPPSTADTSVEAVLALSGLLFANDGTPLSATPIEVALWKNGAAAESRRGFSGRWSRIPGGYSIAFQGGYDASIVHLSDTCRTGTSTQLARPALPQIETGSSSSCRTHRMENGLYPTRRCTSPNDCQTVWVNTFGNYSFCD
jgi:hypothetical protein